MADYYQKLEDSIEKFVSDYPYILQTGIWDAICSRERHISDVGLRCLLAMFHIRRGRFLVYQFSVSLTFRILRLLQTSISDMVVLTPNVIKVALSKYSYVIVRNF